MFSPIDARSGRPHCGVMSKKPCTCRSCETRIALSFVLALCGDLVGAEAVMDGVTWYAEDTSEGYTDTWTAEESAWFRQPINGELVN